ncbi:MAG: MmgE/PrpD family protein [Burkholderiales bacterium]|nr:MmgE/PrpD family protein [Burkholderiales bacterium]
MTPVQDKSTALESMARYVVSERQSVLRPEVLHHARRAVIDWYASLFAGCGMEPVVAMERALEDEIGTGKSRLWSGRQATIRAAAFLNGLGSHAAEVDDVFREGIYHPGSPTIAAALALGQANNMDGLSFVRAVVAGYEISTRISALILRHHYQWWHTTGTVGCIGAAASAAAALRLDERQTVHAMATAVTFASGLQQAFRSDSMTKPMHAGHAAEVGVTCALGALHGLTGAADMLDGDEGFGAAMAGSPDWSLALQGLGSEYNITRMTQKNHCCCGQTFAAIDAALALREQHRFSPADIRGVSIHTYQTALDVTGNYRSDTPAEARFSLPYVVAHALVHGSVRLAAFEGSALADPAVKRIIGDTRMHASEEFNAVFPGKRCASIDITLGDGRLISHVQTTRKGDPDCPLSDQELEGKFFELAIPVIGRARAETLLKKLWLLDEQGDIGQLSA